MFTVFMSAYIQIVMTTRSCLQLGVYRLSQYQLTHWDSYSSLNPSYKDDECNEKSHGQVQVDVQQCSLVERLPV